MLGCKRIPRYGDKLTDAQKKEYWDLFTKKVNELGYKTV